MRLKHLNKTECEMKFKKLIIYCILGLPLLIYPFILFANFMSVLGSSGGVSDLKLLVVKGFLWFSSFYPITYILSLFPFIRKLKYGFLIPLTHLITVIIFLILWKYL